MRRILVIDDDPYVRNLIRAALQQEGRRIHEAADRADAAADLKCYFFDVVFCDLFMPQREGLDAIGDLRRDFPLMKIVAMSGGSCYGDGMDYLHFAELLGASTILRKPFDRRDVLITFEEALQSPAHTGYPPKKASTFGHGIRDWQ